MELRDRSKVQTLFGVSEATIYRVLVTLEHHRYVLQNPVVGRYRLGLRLRQIVQSAGPRLELAAEAYPYMDQLCKSAPKKWGIWTCSADAATRLSVDLGAPESELHHERAASLTVSETEKQDDRPAEQRSA
jgi:hypothetical protein